MKVARVVLTLVLGLPPLASAQQSASARLPLVITDKQAVEEWRRTVWDGPVDSNTQDETVFLLSLTEPEWLGRFEFQQRCAFCHSRRGAGPPLSQKNVVGREEAARGHILEGSARMPAFKYSLEPVTIDAILAYLKRVQKVS